MTLSVIVFLSFLVEAATGFGSMIVALAFGALWLVPVNICLPLPHGERVGGRG